MPSTLFRSIVGAAVIGAVFATGCSTSSPALHAKEALDSLTRADSTYQLGKSGDARTWVHRAITLAPDDVNTWVTPDGDTQVSVVDVLDRNGDYQYATQVCPQAAANPKLGDPWRLWDLIGDANFRLGNMSVSQAAYNNEIAALAKAYPAPGAALSTGVPILLLKASAEWRAGNISQATKDFEFLRRTGGPVGAVAANAEAYNMAESRLNLTQALTISQSALTFQSTVDDDETLGMCDDTLGWIYFELATPPSAKSKDYLDQAITYLDLGVRRYPEMFDMHIHLAKAYEAAGRIRDAYVEYSVAANLQPINKEASEAVIRLKPAAMAATPADPPFGVPTGLPVIGITGAPNTIPVASN